MIEYGERKLSYSFYQTEEGLIEMNFVLECDDNYVEQVIVCMESFYYFHKNENVNLYILHTGWSDNKSKKVIDYMACHGGKVNFINMTSELNKLPYKEQIPKIMYAYLFIEDYVKCNRIFYIDVDIIFNNNISEIWSMDMGENLVAGVLDVSGVLPKVAVGLDEEDYYLNSGFLLLNLVKWREYHFKRKVFEYIHNYSLKSKKRKVENHLKTKYEFWKTLYETGGSVYFHDQGVLNYLARNKIVLLEPKYNVMSPLLTDSFESLRKRWNGNYTKEQYKAAKKEPVIIHYAGGENCKPWILGCKHPYTTLYMKYRNMTEFSGNPMLENKKKATGKRDAIMRFPKVIQSGIYYFFCKIKHIS